MAFLVFCLLIGIHNVYAQCNVKGCPDYPTIIPLNESLFEPILQQIHTYLANITSTNNIPGLISTIVYDEQQIFIQGYGSRDIFNSSSPPPSGCDLVEIGSITKIFTDLLLYYLRDYPHINVNLNDPITKYLPTFSIKNTYNSDPITLIMLSTHTSGLQFEVPTCDFTSNSANCHETKVLNAISQRYLTLRPYSRFHYSNLGTALLGRALEKVFCYGCYEKIMKELILNGLGFSNYSGFNFSEYIIDNYVAAGVAYYDNGKPIRANVNSLGFQNPAGGMLASADDLAKLMMFMFRNNMTVNDHPYQLLNGTTINEIFNPKILLRNGYQSIGNPFEMEYRQFMTIYNDSSDNKMSGVWYRGKAGQLPGYLSSVVMIPEYKIGVFHSALTGYISDDVSDGHVWTYDVLDMLVPYLDKLLYKNGNRNKYVLPQNYQLLTGHYVWSEYSMDIEVASDEVSGRKYLQATYFGGELRLSLFENELNGEIWDKNVLRAHDMNDRQCMWIDAGLDQELIYFGFADGENNHSTTAIVMEMTFNFTSNANTQQYV